MFLQTDTPSVPFSSDSNPVTLGVTFTSAQSGSIVGLRYYKGVGNAGDHIGSLWTSTGTLLASATFKNESVSGWQTVLFDNPISITAGTTYVASYFGTLGYAVTTNYFATPHTRGDQWLLHLRQPEPLPLDPVQRQQLLGRRGVQRRRNAQCATRGGQ
jgi:hypothetical protein